MANAMRKQLFPECKKSGWDEILTNPLGRPSPKLLEKNGLVGIVFHVLGGSSSKEGKNGSHQMTRKGGALLSPAKNSNTKSVKKGGVATKVTSSHIDVRKIVEERSEARIVRGKREGRKERFAREQYGARERGSEKSALRTERGTGDRGQDVMALNKKGESKKYR